MAQQMVTGEEGETEFKFEKWITDNDLNDIRHLLIKHNMISPKTINMVSNSFKLMADPQFLPMQQAQIPKLLAAIQQVAKYVNETKVIRIYISREEEEASDELDKYRETLLQLKKEIYESNDSLSKNVQKCKQNIEISFNAILERINSKKEEILSKLAAIQVQKRAEIAAKSAMIHDGENKVKNVKNECMELQQDSGMNRNERKEAIISMINNVLNNKLAPNAANAGTEIIFDCDLDKILSQFNNNDLIHIYDPQKPLIPLIDEIECKSITRTAANIHFSAKLKEEDKNKKTAESELFLFKLESIEEKEEKMEQNQIEAIKYNKKQEKYVMKLEKLKRDTNYSLCINLYLAGKKVNIAQNIIKFKTKSGALSFRYKYDFDQNGIIYAIGSNFGQKQFSNPHSQKLITINSSNWYCGKVSDILERRQEPFSCYSYNNQQDWFSIDFGSKYKINATRYTLKHDKDDDYYLRDWNLEASNDGKHWNLLKEHKNDPSLNKAFASQTWCVACTETYQMFRIYQTGENSIWYLCCSGFEIYGDLIANL